jgi:hypothetical protein
VPAVPEQSAEFLRECTDEMPTPAMQAELLMRIAPCPPGRDAPVAEAADDAFRDRVRA